LTSSHRKNPTVTKPWQQGGYDPKIVRSAVQEEEEEEEEERVKKEEEEEM
jgi:hypothetical protein